MIVLVTGGSGCGKSTWAEKLVSALPAEKRVYIATMQVYDEESVQRVARHRAQRADKGFTTIECEKDLASADVPEGSVVLLEDLVNLMANEMFGGGDTSRILPALNVLARKCQHLILVTNDVFPTASSIPTRRGNTCGSWQKSTLKPQKWRTAWSKSSIPSPSV